MMSPLTGLFHFWGWLSTNISPLTGLANGAPYDGSPHSYGFIFRRIHVHEGSFWHAKSFEFGDDRGNGFLRGEGIHGEDVGWLVCSGYGNVAAAVNCSQSFTGQLVVQGVFEFIALSCVFGGNPDPDVFGVWLGGSSVVVANDIEAFALGGGHFGVLIAGAEEAEEQERNDF